MSIATIAQRDVVTIDADATLQQAAQLMRDRHIGSLVVVRDGDGDGAAELVGVVTDRDLALEALAEGADPCSAVESACSGELFAMPDSGSIADAAELMRMSGVRRLLLVDSQQQLAGIVTFDDLVASYADQLGDLADALDRGIEREAAGDLPEDGELPSAPVIVPAALAQTWQRVMQP